VSVSAGTPQTVPFQVGWTTPPSTLTEVFAGLNAPIGIVHQDFLNKLLVSVDYPDGSPYNFELLWADLDGTQHHPRFGTAQNLHNEIVMVSPRVNGAASDAWRFQCRRHLCP